MNTEKPGGASAYSKFAVRNSSVYLILWKQLIGQVQENLICHLL